MATRIMASDRSQRRSWSRTSRRQHIIQPKVRSPEIWVAIPPWGSTNPDSPNGSAVGGLPTLILLTESVGWLQAGGRIVGYATGETANPCFHQDCCGVQARRRNLSGESGINAYRHMG